ASLMQIVNKAATTTALSSSTNSSVFGQPVTFTATVTANPPGAGTLSGTVTFKDGTTSLATSSLSGGVATYTNAALSVTNHSITAVYSGDANFNSSTNSPALTQTVSKATTLDTLTSSTNPAAFGQSVIFTANVSAVSPGAG